MTNNVVVYVTVTASLGIVVGILIGRFGLDQGELKNPSQMLMDDSAFLWDGISAVNINNNLKQLKGKKEELERAEWVRDQLLNAGSDHSYLVPTNQLLPASRATKRGVISVSSASDANSSRTNQMTPVHNVIATIHGSQEPDRYILIGNRLDGWNSGGPVDASSGTAVMLEMARVIGLMKQKNDWRPRRTIVFCGWGASQKDISSLTTPTDVATSFQWAENNANILNARGVAYLNLDTVVNGNYSLYGAATPILHSLLRKAAKKIVNPDPSEVKQGRATVYDTWKLNNPDPGNHKQPKIDYLDGESDFAAFSHVLGVPSVNLMYTSDSPVKSSPFDNSSYYETDKTFQFHQAIGQLMTEMVRDLSEAVILPFDIELYASFLKAAFNNLQKPYNHLLQANGVSIEHLRKNVEKFTNLTDYFVHNTLVRLDKTNKMAVRRVNDQLMLLERSFIYPRRLPAGTELNVSHVVLTTGSGKDSTFVGLVELLRTVANETETEKPRIWHRIQQQLSLTSYLIGAAADSLKETL